MLHKRFARILSVILGIAMVVPYATPVAAYASQEVMHLEDHASPSASTEVSKLTIDDVDAPEPGEELDDTAVVTSAEGEQWDIAVLWVNESLQLATVAEEGHAYLPILAFFLPDTYTVGDVDASGGFEVTLAEDLVKLFMGNEIISIHDASTGITYILPASIRNFFAQSEEQAIGETEALPQGDTEAATPFDSHVPTASGGEPESELARLTSIYCSDTAREAIPFSELETLVNLVKNRLQPQAVNLLIDKFPAFKAAASKNELGKQIGLYIYYKEGDKDGDPSHENTPENALAYVAWNFAKTKKGNTYGYLLALDAASCVTADASGKLVLDLKGSKGTTLENTIVHEMFHAFMDDYNRTGMTGINDIRKAIIGNSTPTKAQNELYIKLHYPRWFIEGTASAVENVYSFRKDSFDALYAATGDYDRGSNLAILSNYLNGTVDGAPAYFGLLNSYGGKNDDGSEISTSNSRYVTGYLAVLYLGELAARRSTGSSVKQDDDNLSISSEKIRLGLNSILERMHKGETLDSVIADISPVDENGKKTFVDIDDFENKFIRGAAEPNGENYTYYGEADSLGFVRTFLFYMDALSKQDRRSLPNGSILYDFHMDYDTPLDDSKDATSKLYRIIESNTYTNSTVKDSVALAGGGTSDPNKILAASSGTSASDEFPLAAKDEAEATEQVATETEQVAEPESTPEAAAPAETPVAAEPSPEPEYAPSVTETEAVAPEATVVEAEVVEEAPVAAAKEAIAE